MSDQSTHISEQLSRAREEIRIVPFAAKVDDSSTSMTRQFFHGATVLAHLGILQLVSWDIYLNWIGDVL